MVTSIKYIVQTQIPGLCEDWTDWNSYREFRNALEDLVERNKATEKHPLIHNRLVKRTVVETDEVIGET